MKKKITEVKSSEAEQQEALIDFCNKISLSPRYKDLKLIYHIPNGGSRNTLEAKNLKKQGVKAGVPDLFLPVAKGGYFGLYIEMKWGKNKATDEQLKWMAELRNQGYAVWLCYGSEVAKNCLEQYISFPPTEIIGERKEFERIEVNG